MRCCLALSTPLWAWTFAVAGGTPTVDEVIDGMERCNELLLDHPGFLIVCAREKSEALLPGPDGSLLRAEWVMAHKAANWLIQQRFLDPHVTEKVAVPAEPQLSLLSSQRVLDWTQYNRHCVVDRFGDGRNMYNGWDYLRNLGINVYPRICAAGGADYEVVRHDKRHDLNMSFPFLPEFLRSNRGRYVVREQREVVGGVPCWVVEWPGMDRIAVDSAHRFVVRHRACHWAPEKPLRIEVSNAGFHEVKPGLFLPFEQVVTTYVDVRYRPESLWGKPANRSVYAVKRIELTDVSDELFKVRLPAGTMVTDLIRQIQYRVPAANAEPFDEPVTYAKRLLRPSAHRMWAIAGTALLPFLLIAILGTRWVFRLRALRRKKGFQ
jgi:hypothetical protein